MKDSADQPPPTLKAPFVLVSSLPTGAAKQAVETLGRLIANDTYQPGEVMPTEPELADKLEVSRATIRDAIKVLSGKGMVRTARRYGTRVRPVAEWNLLDTDVASWHDAGNPRIHRMFTETTELRSILEPEAAALAAERATPDQIQTLLGAAEAMRTENVPDLFAADCLFHATLLDATGNLMMRQLRPIILTVLRISYEVGVFAVDGATINRLGHLKVAEAVRDRDSDRARTEMARMLANNREISLAYRTGAAPPA